MAKKDTGFSMLELLTTLLIIGIIAAISLPVAINAVKGYRLHADGTAIASYMNVARMKAASQYAPYRLKFDLAAGTYQIEELCGINRVGDPACTAPGATSYTLHAGTIGFDLAKLGTQYATVGNMFSTCRAAGIPAPTTTPYNPSPGTITGDPPCAPAGNVFSFYFNTRGAPVDGTSTPPGNPLTNGGSVIYIINQDNNVDAVTVSLGGRAQVWNWSWASTQWYAR